MPGANTQGTSLQEVKENLKEAISLVLEANRKLSRQTSGTAEVLRESIAA